jgi:hypothetical protein
MICRTWGTELPGLMVCPNCNTWQGEVIPGKKRSKVGTIIHNIIQVIGIGLWIFCRIRNNTVDNMCSYVDPCRNVDRGIQ